jgi:hypothetical protein
VNAPGLEVLFGDVSHVLWRGFTKHEYFDWYILEAWADDRDKHIDVFLVSEFNLTIGGHDERRIMFASTNFGMGDVEMVE